MIQVQNRLVQITTKSKSTSIRNHICDNYLKYINLGQFKDEQDAYFYNRSKLLDKVCIKFDDPIENPENSVKTDYDVYMQIASFGLDGNSMNCNVTYTYNSQTSFKKTEDDTNVDINNYAGRQIATLGFYNDSEILAYIDTSSFDLKIIQDERLFIRRIDEFSTNMECVGQSFPFHIAPTRSANYVYNEQEQTWKMYDIDSFLYSIGFGTQKNRMNYEYILDNNEIDIIKTDTTFSFALKTGDKLTLYPHSSLMPSSSKFPLRMYSLEELHPNNNLYLGSSKYPLKSNFKYIILKYRLYKTNSNGEQIPTDKFYTMNLYSDYIGVFEVKSKIERRT